MFYFFQLFYGAVFHLFKKFGIVLFPLLLALPVFISDFQIFKLTTALVYIIILLGLNIIFGYSGQYSIGHAAFALMGAYTAACLNIGSIHGIILNGVFSVLMGGFASLAVGVAFGIPCLRMEGPYLALATQSLAIVVPVIIRSRYLEPFTKGSAGINIHPLSSPAWFLQHFPHFSDEKWQFYIVLIPTVVIVLILKNLLATQLGRAFIAIRDNPTAAATLGIHVRKYKIIAFGLSSFLAGLGGAILVFLTGYLRYDSYTFIDSITYLIVIVVGGLASIEGCIVGSLVLVYQSNINNLIGKCIPGAQDLHWAIFGSFVIIIMLFSEKLNHGGLGYLLKKYHRKLLYDIQGVLL